MKLARRYVEKPWGRTRLPPMFDPPPGKRIGEIWFEGGNELPLLAKYLFTSERLSVQVHPDDDQARARGLPNGKSECWYVLEAEDGATIGLGPGRGLTEDALRTAAADGSIVDLLDWKNVRPGDFLYVPAGTIHAIGGGLSLLEIQQNSGTTYRLYDYGRPRELRVDDAIAVADRSPYPAEMVQHLDSGEECLLVDGPQFVIVASTSDRLCDRLRWIMPISGAVRSGGDSAGPGNCLLVEPGEELDSDGAWLLIAASA